MLISQMITFSINLSVRNFGNIEMLANKPGHEGLQYFRIDKI